MTHTPARRGDLAAVVTTTRDYVIGAPTTERTSVRIGVVTSITREGIVKMVDGRKLWNHERTLVISATRIDVEAALAIAAAHVWPSHTSTMPYASIEEARDALRPALRSPAA